MTASDLRYKDSVGKKSESHFGGQGLLLQALDGVDGKESFEHLSSLTLA